MQRFCKWIVATLREAAWAPCAVFLAYLVLHEVFLLGLLIPEFDIFLHLLGGIAVAYFFHRALISAVNFGILEPFHLTTHVVLVFLLVCTTAVLWELAEFACDRVVGTGQQLGSADTLVDLLMGAAGGTVFLVASWKTRGSPHGR